MDGLFSNFPQSFRPSFAPSQKRPSMLGIDRQQRRHDGFGRKGFKATDRLFFAVLPDSETAARIANLAQRLRRGHGLRGKPLLTPHFHATLFHVVDCNGFPPDLIDMLAKRAATVTMPSFKVAFDRAGSFDGGAFVLRGDDGLIGLEILQQRLSDALDGRPDQARSFTPHVTLLRDKCRIDEHPIEPIEWTVKELVLVHSLLGRTTHRHVARLPLG